MKHKHYELCRRAHLNTSFHPEKRAEQSCKDFDAMQKELEDLGARAETIEKSERLFIAWQSARGNCISSMITGPANFPTRRAEKANNAEMNRSTEYFDHFNKVKKAIEKERYYETHPEARPISNSDDDALSRLKDKLAKLEAERVTNNAINKIVRRKPKNEATPEKLEELRKLGLSEKGLHQIFEPDFCGRIGVSPYVNQNLGGNIKRVKERIESLEKTKQLKTERIDLGNDVFVTQDPEAMRVFFEFDGKPSDEIRTLLKSKGFRWTPSQGHWGRKLTGNASHAARQVMEALKAV